MADEKKKEKLTYPAKPEKKIDFTYDYILAHAKEDKAVAEWLREYYTKHEGKDLKLPKLRSEYADKFWKDAFPKKVIVKNSASDTFWAQINKI